MIVALDMQLSLGTATGIGEYVQGLASALQRRSVRIVQLSEPRLDPWRFDRRVMWDQFLLPARARASGADLLHCASGTMPLRCALPTVVTVHDVAWLKAQRHVRAYARYYFGTFALRRYRCAAAVVTDSEFSRAELLEAVDLPRDRVHVIYPGVDGAFAQLQRSRDHAGQVILVPGTLERRKNFEVLIRALPGLPSARLIAVGPFTPYRADCERLAGRLGVADRVELRGYVARSELLDLYARCALVAVPSLYEGFGYAAAQALCAGTPVIVSDRASLPEVVSESASIAPAQDAAAWRDAIAAVLRDPAAAQARADAQRERAVARFCWDASAQAMLGVYQRAARERTNA